MTAAQILAGLPRLSALVVGDVCLDRWCTYDPATSEPSRETGIPRIGVVRTDVSAGGGGTVANNLVALGARAAVLGVIGDDGHGHELRRALPCETLLGTVRSVPTFTYTKLINAGTGIEDQPRIDFISTQPLPAEVERQVLDRLESVAAGFDVILISDQAETGQGVVTPAVRRLLANLALRHPEKIFWADSRKHIHEFRRVIIKPNREEADAACLRLFGGIDYPKLREHARAPFMVVTMGSEGALLVEPAGLMPVAALPVAKPLDICGAGDSFSAGAALALAVTGSPADAVRFGNLVASITIMKKGTGTASPREVLEAAAGTDEHSRH